MTPYQYRKKIDEKKYLKIGFINIFARNISVNETKFLCVSISGQYPENLEMVTPLAAKNLNIPTVNTLIFFFFVLLSAK